MYPKHALDAIRDGGAQKTSEPVRPRRPDRLALSHTASRASLVADDATAGLMDAVVRKERRALIGGRRRRQGSLFTRRQRGRNVAHGGAATATTAIGDLLAGVAATATAAAIVTEQTEDVQGLQGVTNRLLRTATGVASATTVVTRGLAGFASGLTGFASGLADFASHFFAGLGSTSLLAGGNFFAGVAAAIAGVAAAASVEQATQTREQVAPFAARVAAGISTAFVTPATGSDFLASGDFFAGGRRFAASRFGGATFGCHFAAFRGRACTTRPAAATIQA